MDIQKIDNLVKQLELAEDKYSIIITSKNSIDEILGNDLLKKSYFASDINEYKIRGVYRNGHSLFFINIEDIDLKEFENLIRK